MLSADRCFVSTSCLPDLESFTAVQPTDIVVFTTVTPRPRYYDHHCVVVFQPLIHLLTLARTVEIDRRAGQLSAHSDNRPSGALSVGLCISL